MRVYRRIVLLIITICIIPTSLFALTAEEIMRKADNLQTFATAESAGEFQIKDRFGVKVSTFTAWSRGKEDSLIEFTSIAERGQKILRTKDSLYLYYPDAEELIRMQGSALRQGMLGSDVSYEDMTGGKDRLSDYDVTLAKDETIDGRPCYVLHLSALTRSVPYPKETVWIDKENFLVMRGEYSTKSGRLLKEMETLETGVFDGIPVATKTRISDMMKSDSETLIIISDLKVNIPLDERIFSLEELSW